MNILVAGGAGFIGSHLVDYHLSLKDKVFVVDNLSTGKLTNLSQHTDNPDFKFYESNLLDWPELKEILSQCDIVYDLAAVVGMFNVLEHPIETLYMNINITDKILSIIAELDHKPFTLIASSSEVYGSKPTAMHEDDALILTATNRTHASYPVSKLCNEISGVAYFKKKHLPLTITRIFNTVGPRQSSRYGMVLPHFVQEALAGEPLTIYSDGSQTRCFFDVRDICKVFHQLTLSPQCLGEIVNVGSTREISILDLAKLVIQLSRSKSDLTFYSYETIYGDDYIDIQNRRPDLTKLKSFIDYNPQWTLENTIENMIEIYLQKN